MHSRKSIFYRGIVFIASIFAMAIFSQIRVGAACEVGFADGVQYLTMGGGNSNWSDSGITLIEPASCSKTYEKGKIYVNGSEKSSFIIQDYSEGHYTVEYKYTLDLVEHSIYRYVRILNPNFDTTTNYTLGFFDVFEENSDTQIVNAFYDSSNKTVINFVVSGNSTYLVITNLMSKEILRREIIYSVGTSQYDFKVSDVLRDEDNNYYLIGNTSLGGVIRGFKILSSNVTDIAATNTHNSASVYNSGYFVSDTEIYLSGNDMNGNPIVDVFGSTITNYYTHDDAKGSYSSVIVKHGVVYAVGYTTSGMSTKGLYSYIPKADKSAAGHSSIFTEDSKFTKIIESSSTHNIVIGSTNALQITAGGTVSAVNTKPGYSDALVLEVSNEALVNQQARLYGGSSNDIFNNITHIDGTKYVLTGAYTYDGTMTSMSYLIDIADFSAEEELVSNKSSYLVNGAINTPYGVSYYGKILNNSEKIVDIYYPRTVTIGDPLLLILDNRKFTGEGNRDLTNETILLVQKTKEKIEELGEEEKKYYELCHYNIKFGSVLQESFDCKNVGTDPYVDSSVVTTTNIGTLLDFYIDIEKDELTGRGAKIIIYRTIVITEAPKPIDLSSGKTGILKWYIYDRISNYSPSSTAIRLNPNATEYVDDKRAFEYTANFKYYVTSIAEDSDIFDMINHYINTGEVDAYSLESATDKASDAKVFAHSNQTSAAFASIEYAKMFAYYQEFSRVVRVNLSGSQVGILGEDTYSGAQHISPTQDHYYIYYIDYAGKNYSGNNATGLYSSCKVTTSSVTNCTGKAGYAFSSLKEVSSVIRNLLEYQNYFVSTRHTVYNGSYLASEIEEYKQELYTAEYVKSYAEKIRASTNNLSLNVYKIGEDTPIYSGMKKDVYFGLKKVIGEDKYTYENSEVLNLTSKTVNGHVYYSNDKAVYFMENACYEIYYSSETGEKGTSKQFCLDNTPPKIIYHEERDEETLNKVHDHLSTKGNEELAPVYIASDFTIVNLDDLDDYAYIMVNKQVYPITCSDMSISCLLSIDEYVKQTFRYNRNDPTKVHSISFADRTGNGITLYFVVGTVKPSIKITDLETENKGTPQDPDMVTLSFSMVINFYETNGISDFQLVDLSRQNCGAIADASNPCYQETTPDEIANTIYSETSQAAKEFNEMVTNYIKAVSFRDRDNLEGIIVMTPDADGQYINTINEYIYKIIDGSFVEISGYEETYKLVGNQYIYEGEPLKLEENFFVKNEVIYVYDKDENTIQAKKIDVDWELLSIEPSDWKDNYNKYYYAQGLNKVLNENKEFTPGYYYRKNLSFVNEGSQINLNANNEFKFNNKDERIYRVVAGETAEDSYVEALPISYKIENDNTFRIDYNDTNGRIIYTYDPITGLINYANPLTQTAKRIELIFTRTTKVSGGVPVGGVDVPVTIPKHKNGTETIEIDPRTGLEIYTFDPEAKSKHFYIVDGVYTFNIAQTFGFGTIPSESGSIYVTKLDLKLGYTTDGGDKILLPQDPVNAPYTINGFTGKGLDFTGTQDKTIHVKAFDNQYIYPYKDDVIPSIKNYDKTYFSDRSVFVGFTVKERIVFTIKISKERNQYGLPKSQTCQEIIILGSGFTEEEKNNVSQTCTSTPYVMRLKNDQGYSEVSQSKLSEYGIYELKTEGGVYAFSGENIFYEISLVEQGDVSSIMLKESFYIDGRFEEDTISGIVSTIKESGGNIELDAKGNIVLSEYFMYGFEKDGDEYVLKNKDTMNPDAQNTIGGKINVQFNFDFYDGTASDLNENKLLLMHLVVDGTSYTCNVYKSMTNNPYARDCSGGYIDQTLTVDDEEMGISRLVFSGSGDYTVVFEDAGKNRTTYKFVIDKSAPDIRLENVDFGDTPFRKEQTSPTYQVLSYVKTPTFGIVVEDDLSLVNEYCYQFSYAIGATSIFSNELCPNVATNPSNQLTANISMEYAEVDGASLIEVLTGLAYDGNVTLTITSSDALGNETTQNMEINFWADYSAPEFTETKGGNLNEEFITPEDIGALSTITVISESYFGKIFSCPSEGFKFDDLNQMAGVRYTYIVHCGDIHNAPTGSYPLVYGFANTITMAFYEVDTSSGSKEIKIGDDGNPVEFQFGEPTVEGIARWIAIKVRDYVGNESIDTAYMPIFVSDKVAPFIVENGVNKCIRMEEENCLEWEVINYREYILNDNVSEVSTVYVSNSNVRVTMSEYIKRIASCTVGKYDSNFNLVTQNAPTCEYETGTEYKYNDKMYEFTFKTDNSDINHFKIIRIKMADFAGQVTEKEIIIVIDRINPTAQFKSSSDVIIEYGDTSSLNPFFNSSSEYNKDLYITDDQGDALTDTKHEFYRYAPLLTYKNYKKVGGEYVKVQDFQLKTMETYYLLIDATQVNDKECIEYIGDNKHCYVVDTANTYYFDDLLEYNKKNNIQVWTNIGLDLQPITQLSGSSGIAVYKIAYQVVDAAGNKSDVLYKKVFVVDTKIPDINIYDDYDNLLYEDVASTNPNNFTGKINSTVRFAAKDLYESKAKLMFYTCDIRPYSENPQSCPISKDVLYYYTAIADEKPGMFGPFNSYTFRRDAGDGVYKAYAFDNGQYLLKDDEEKPFLYGEDTEVYVLTRNMSSVYFAINEADVTASFKIFGNQFSNFTNGNMYFEESDTNYIEIRNNSDSKDVRLMMYDIGEGKYIDISKGNAIGHSTVFASPPIIEDGIQVITVFYKDEEGRSVYEIKYKQADLTNGFMVHETYYYLSGVDATVCVVGKGESMCEQTGNQALTYVVDSVVARIYEDGSYPALTFVDNFGNTSPFLSDPLFVDNTPYTLNKDNNAPTGINYWFSVPSEALIEGYAEMYYSEIQEDVYAQVASKPADWELTYQNFFVKDGENFVKNTNDDFDAGKYYSFVGKAMPKEVNVTKYDGGLNSSFFYAIASRAEAEAYMLELYKRTITQQLATGYVFYDVYGNEEFYNNSKTVDQIIDENRDAILEMIVPTFVEDKKFSDESVEQKEYQGELGKIASTMYQYTYILRTKTINNGKITYTHKLEGDTCTVDPSKLPSNQTQECIKVNLKIVSKVDFELNIQVNTSINKLNCVSVNLSLDPNLENDACIISKDKLNLLEGAEGTIVYIDQDVTNPYHRNMIYYGFRVYSESAEVNLVELGTYIPMEKIKRYDNNREELENGDYIWINSTLINFNEMINNTNLYSKSCKFNGVTYNNGCVFVSYFSTYKYSNTKYIPHIAGTHYYDYYTDTYNDNRQDIIDNVNRQENGKEVEFTYSQEGDLCTAQGACGMIPVYVNNNFKKPGLYNSGNDSVNQQTNQKTYVELFNSKNKIDSQKVVANKISRLFEVITTIEGGVFKEIYSYATLSINVNGAEKYYNINSKIIKIPGYTQINTKPLDWGSGEYYKYYYTYDGTDYVPLTQHEEWSAGKYHIKEAFACIIDIKLETKYSITITDSAGNKIKLNVSHTEKVPDLSYEKLNPTETDSGVKIEISTKSTVETLEKNDIKIYKYDFEAHPNVYSETDFKDISENNDETCFKLDIGSSIVLTLNYNSMVNCVGVYRIKVIDDYGNTRYKDIVFNPYVINNKFNTIEQGVINKTHIYENVNLIANEFFTIDVDSNLSYVNIYKYPSYTNLTLDSVNKNDIKVVSIINFTAGNQIPFGETSCFVYIEGGLNGLYTLRIKAEDINTHSCDGVYKIEVVNLFSSTLSGLQYSEFSSLEGANSFVMIEEKPEDWHTNVYKYYYYDSELRKYVQLRGTAPNWEENKYYTQSVAYGYATSLAGGQTIEIDSIAPDKSILAGDNQNFNLYIDEEEIINVEKTKELLESPTKTIEFTNKFITVAWGGYPSYSLTSLKYKYKGPSVAQFPDEWTTVSDNVTYQVPFNASFEFAPTQQGLHEYIFKFVDAVGNEDGEAEYKLKIKIDPPDVGFYEVVVDPITGLPLRENGGERSIIAGRKYLNGERIPLQTILKCVDVDGIQLKDCKINDYDYSMVVNENNYPSYSDQMALKLPINQDSQFLWSGNDGSKAEIKVKLTVSIKGKPGIATELYVIIDRKAPEIEIIGDKAEKTTIYINSVVVKLDSEDTTNIATIYKCDAIVDETCMDRLPNGDLVDGGKIVAQIGANQFTYLMGNDYSGYFMVVATDDPVNLGNESRRWFALDNEAPTIEVKNDLTTLAPHTYTNAENVKANIVDELSADNGTINVEYTALLNEDKELEATMTYNKLTGLTKQGKYVLTPVDGVGRVGESITIYIYRQTPEYELSGDGNAVRKEVVLSWKAPESELYAPIVSVTVDGEMYNATYNTKENKYIGAVINEFGEHMFAIVDAAGNRRLVMATVNNTNNVCIDGNLINVKRQYNYQIDKLIIGGKDEGFAYSKDDVIIFALPSQATGSDCVSNGLLGYRTLDPQNSHFLINSTGTAARMNANQFDFVEQGFISKEAIAEVTNVGETVVVFVITKDIANHTLGYSVGTNFFMEDPLGWTMIFITAILALIPARRIFVKKKVRVI